MMLTPEEKSKIKHEIDARIPNYTCPICRNTKFALADGYFNSPLNANPMDFTFGGSSIPSIGIVCDNCGFISYHAAGILGLLNKENK